MCLNWRSNDLHLATYISLPVIYTLPPFNMRRTRQIINFDTANLASPIHQTHCLFQLTCVWQTYQQSSHGLSNEEGGEAEDSREDDNGLTSEEFGNEELSEEDNGSDDDQIFLDEDAEEDESCCESDGFQGGNLKADFQSGGETTEECSQEHKASGADGRISSKPSRVCRAPRKPPSSDDAPEGSWDPDIDEDKRPTHRTLLSYPGWKAKQGLPSHSEHDTPAHLKDGKSDGMRNKKSGIDSVSLNIDEIEDAHPVHGSKPAINRFQVSKQMRGSRPRIHKGRPLLGPLTLTRNGPFATPITTSRTAEPVRATYPNRTNRPNIDSLPGIQSRPVVSPEAARQRITRALHNFDRRGSRPRRTVYRQRQRGSSEDETGVGKTGAYTGSDESDGEEPDRRSRARGSDVSVDGRFMPSYCKQCQRSL